jgi:CRP-like cAMP-binding protein
LRPVRSSIRSLRALTGEGAIAPAQPWRETALKLDESLLLDLPPFSRLTKGQVRDVLDQATPMRFDEGKAVFAEGMPAERFYLLLDGHVRVVRATDDGGQVIAMHIPPGQLFGIASAIGRDTYPATAVAASELLTLGWPTRLWATYIAYDGFATASYRTVGDRLVEVHESVVALATQAVEQRVAVALLRMTNQSGRRTDEGIEISFPITRAEIAEMTGTTLHTVSRLLSAWERDGIVKSTRRHITVIGMNRLVARSAAAEK